MMRLDNVGLGLVLIGMNGGLTAGLQHVILLRDHQLIHPLQATLFKVLVGRKTFEEKEKGKGKDESLKALTPPIKTRSV